MTVTYGLYRRNDDGKLFILRSDESAYAEIVPSFFSELETEPTEPERVLLDEFSPHKLCMNCGQESPQWLIDTPYADEYLSCSRCLPTSIKACAGDSVCEVVQL